MNWIYVIISEICSYAQYFYTQINNNHMRRELFHIMLGVIHTEFHVQPALEEAAMKLMWPTVEMSLTPLL